MMINIVNIGLILWAMKVPDSYAGQNNYFIYTFTRLIISINNTHVQAFYRLK